MHLTKHDPNCICHPCWEHRNKQSNTSPEIKGAFWGLLTALAFIILLLIIGA